LIIFVNFNSLLTHKLLFESFLLEEKAKAFILNETHLTTKNNVMSDYKFIHQTSTIPALRVRGGVVIGHKPSVPHYSRPIPHMMLPEYLISSLYFKNLYVTLVKI